MVFSVLYEISLFIAFLCFLPKALWQALRYKKYRKSFWLRLGFGFPEIKKKNGPLFWIHAVSVGETQAIVQFVNKLKTETPNSVVVISSVTETGHATALRSIPKADYHVFLPFDFWLTVRHIAKKCNPDVVLFCETDLWWRFLHTMKKKGALCLVLSGKLSERSFRRLQLVAPFTQRLFRLVDLFCVQNDLFKERLSTLKVPSQKIHVTGNIKGDHSLSPLTPEERKKERVALGIADSDFVLVIGSTHAPEERDLLKNLEPFLQHKSCKVILVPRHPERFDDVEKIVSSYSYSYSRWKSHNKALAWQVMVVDQMGLLTQLYGIADLAIVAGSFTEKVGGHNIVEPMAKGIVTLCGPHMHTQKHLLEGAKYFNAIIQVELPEVCKMVQELKDSEKRCVELQKQGLAYSYSLKGATDRTIEALKATAPQFFPSH